MSSLKDMKAAYIFACVALVVLFATLASAAEEKNPQVLAINVNILDGKADKLAEGMSALVEANLIKTIGGETIKANKGDTAICGVEMGKDVWLAGQGIGILIYVFGIAFAFGGIRRHHLGSATVPATPAHAGH